MKNINKLKQKLQKISSKKQMSNNIEIENISLTKFIRYKFLSYKERKMKKQLKKCYLAEKEANLVYKVNVHSWFKNQNINCRQYCKLEQKAEYKRDKVLFQLGLIPKKPTPPIIQNVKNFISENSFLTSFLERLNFNISNSIPKKINKFTINTAKVAIRGYRTIDPYYSSAKKYLCSKKTFLYFKKIIAEAMYQLNLEALPTTRSNPGILSEEAQNFRNSIKLTSDYNNSFMYKEKPPIKQIKKNPTSIKKEALEYIL